MTQLILFMLAFRMMRITRNLAVGPAPTVQAIDDADQDYKRDTDDYDYDPILDG